MQFWDYFKRAALFSLLGHVAFLGIFSLSFGEKMPPANLSNVYFFGRILRDSDLVPPLSGINISSMNNLGNWDIKTVFTQRKVMQTLDRTRQEQRLFSGDYLKPLVNIAISPDKVTVIPKLASSTTPPRKRESVIMFYPRLPYEFVLYFKDRQVAHMELAFNIVRSPDGIKHSLSIKRRISSGNLEMDLLSMRYISRYLFMQEMAFAPNNWQTVKIDLSALKDSGVASY